MFQSDAWALIDHFDDSIFLVASKAMSLELLGYIGLPGDTKPGGFDHAAVHRGSGRLYVAHTANDCLDVIDGILDLYLHSIGTLAGVAGALVSDERNLVFTSNRGEDTVGIFVPGDEAGLAKVDVGARPNGLAYDSSRDLLLAANVGDPVRRSRRSWSNRRL